MSANDHRRQKKLQRRASKRKERQRELVKQKNRGLAGQLAAAKSAPIVDSLLDEMLFENGLGEVLLSRKLPSGEVAFSLFLVDQYCLGVKDAFGRICSPAEYREFIERLAEATRMIKHPPANLRRLVEGAVDYARDLGLEPHPDYNRLKAIFGDIDPEESTERFTFGGQDGKPHFISGPGENPQRCQQILSILEHSCGRGGFDYTMAVSGAPSRSEPRLVGSTLGVDYEDEDDEDD